MLVLDGCGLFLAKTNTPPVGAVRADKVHLIIGPSASIVKARDLSPVKVCACEKQRCGERGDRMWIPDEKILLAVIVSSKRSICIT